MRIKKLTLPVSDELLRKYNFFELYPFDGGGCFINRDILGTINDDEIFEKIINNGALKDFGTLPDLDFERFERWGNIEKSCWLNRFYFIVPLAKKYWLTKDEKIASTVKNIILHFIRTYKAPVSKEEIGAHLKRVFKNRDDNYNSKTYEEYSKDETDVEYIWFDFQPASRILHFLYAFHFLQDSKSISASEWAELEESIHIHARVIMLGEKYFSPLAKGNHQSLRGMALLLAGAFFSGTERGGEYQEEGLRICNYHIENDFLDDGVLHEVSPSYHIFETWHVRDARLTAEKYNFKLSANAEKVLRGAADFAFSLCQPDGKSTVINDGYPLALQAFLESMPFVNDNKASNNCVSYFADAGLAFFRDEKRYMLLDSSIFTGSFSHYHGGKNAFTYWFNGKPFFIDNGCCSYDDPAFASFKTPEVHSSLLIDGHGDSILNGTYNWKAYAETKCSGWKQASEESYTIESVLRSSVPTWKNASWKRGITINKGDTIIINDEVSSDCPREFCFIFNLHPDVKIREIKEDCAILANGPAAIRISFESKEKYMIIKSNATSFIDFKKCENQQLKIYMESSAACVLRTLITHI